VIPTAGEYGKRWGMSFPQEKRVSKRGPKGKLIMGINSTHFLEFYYHWG
jgi:hypothetical protein